jgi:quercetin dioxygenase-like cupin family protein
VSYPPVRYRGARGEATALLRRAAEPAELVTPSVEVRELATGAKGADVGLYRWTMTGAPTGPAPHFHRTMSESFFVLSGEVRLYDGREWLDAAEGDFLHVPPGGVHAFRNESGERADMLILFSPAAPREEYFHGLEEIRCSGRVLTEEEWTAFYAAHDQYHA